MCGIFHLVPLRQTICGKKTLEKGGGRNLGWHHGGEGGGWLIWEEDLFRGGFQHWEDTMAKISKVPVCLPNVAQTLQADAAIMYIVIRHH